MQAIDRFLLDNNPLKINLKRLYTVSGVNKHLIGVDFSWALKDDHGLQKKGVEERGVKRFQFITTFDFWSNKLLGQTKLDRVDNLKKV